MQRNGRKRVCALRSWVTWILLISSILAACGAPTPVVEPASIRFLHNEADTAFLTQAVERFNQEYPEITVTLTPIENVTLQQIDVLKPDCLSASMFGLGTQSEIAQRLISLDGYLEGESSLKLEDYYPSTLQLVSWEGRTWAIPAGINPLVMFYNKDLFDRASAPYPKPGWTWDDFLNAALATTNAEAGVWGYVALENIIDPIMFIFQHGGNIVDNLDNPTSVTFNDPLTVEAVEWYANLFTGYKVAPTRADVGSGASVYRLIFEGRAGMWSATFDLRGGEWSERELNWPFQLGVAPLPRDAQAATYGDVEVYAISAQSQAPDACWRWISFLSTQANEAWRMVPARQSVAESKEYELILGNEYAAAARAAVEETIALPSVDQLAAFMPNFEAFGMALQRVLAGEVSAQEALDAVQQQAVK